MKNLILIFSFNVLIFCSCGNNKADDQKSTATEIKNADPEEQVQNDNNPNETSVSETDNSLSKFAGNWSQEVKGETEVTGKLSLAKIQLSLKEDGTFTGTEELMTASAEVNGQWKIQNDHIVLDFNGNHMNLKPENMNNDLVDEALGVHLKRN